MKAKAALNFRLRRASRHLLQHPNGHNNDNNRDLLICFDVFLETKATSEMEGKWTKSEGKWIRNGTEN